MNLFLIIIGNLAVDRDGFETMVDDSRFYVDAVSRRSAVAWYLQEHCRMDGQDAGDAAKLTAFVHIKNSAYEAVVPLWGHVIRFTVDVPEVFTSVHDI